MPGLNENAASVSLPWAPIYSVYRSGLPEISVQGIVYVWAEDRKLYANSGRSLLKLGDTRADLWSRSLLKPFQLMALYPTLKTAYPALTERHFAMMTASQSGTSEQIALLRDILKIGGLSESDLQCTACRSMADSNGGDKSVLNHPCAGKHLAHLLYLKAQSLPLDSYLQADAAPYAILQNLLEYLLGKTDFAVTVDGCGMPNYAVSAVETAQLYHALAMPVSRDLLRQAPDDLEEVLTYWEAIGALFRQYPELIGGPGRLDTRLMQDYFPADIPVIAKEGADGLLALGIGAHPQFADGLGILINIASGYEPRQLEIIVKNLLSQLQLIALPAGESAGVVETRLHFQLAEVAV